MSADEFAAAWAALALPLQRCLELAYATLCSGGLACGSVITDAAGAIIAEGRNRAYDPPGGDEILQANPLAHAELNALARIPNERDLDDCTLWSSQQPCSMCRAAIEFVELGGVRFLAVDPAFLGTPAGQEAGQKGPISQAVDGPPEWPVVANVLFLHNIVVRRGPGSETVVRNLELDPAPTELAIALAGEKVFAGEDDLATALASQWDRFVRAATASV